MPRHSYGWTPSLPDVRDHVFAAPSHVVKSLPKKVDLTNPALPAPFEPTWDQGSLGSCGPHAAGADIVYAALRQQNRGASPMPSRLFIYYCTRQLMNSINQDSGVTNRAMLKALAKYGWCDEELWPYSVSHFTVKPPDHAYKQAAERRIEQYISIPQNHDSMRAVLAGGDAFIFGFSVYSSMETEAVERTGIIPMPTSRDRLMGGHDILVVGYDDASERYLIKNSWGGWGRGGYGTIPYQYAINPRLAGDFWTIKHAALPDAPAPQPDPPIPVPEREVHVTIEPWQQVVVKVTQ